MKKFLFTITLFATLALWGSCTQEINLGGYTFTGAVVDATSGKRIAEVPVKVTNGMRIYTSTKTDAYGEFELRINIHEIDNLYYILIGDETMEQKRVEIRGFSSYETNLGTIELQWQVKPKVHTFEIEDMDYTNGEATLRGKIESVGRPKYYMRGFVWSTTPGPTINDDYITNGGYLNPGTGGSIGTVGAFSNLVTGLPEKSTFYVRAFAVYGNTSIGHVINEEDIAYGNEVCVSFVKVSTQDVTDIESNDSKTYSATFNGHVDDAGSPAYVERGFVYNTHSSPTVGNGTNVPVSGSGKTGTFSASVSDIQSYKTYYVRAYVKTEKGYTYGETVTFTTY